MATPRPIPPRDANRDQEADDAAELALVERVREGDQQALADLLRRYQDRLYSVCVRMVTDRELAADLTQDAFVKIIQGLDGFDGRSKLSTWMIRVTMNCCLSRLRKEKLRRHASLDGMMDGSRSDSGRRGGGSGSPGRTIGFEQGSAHNRTGEPDVPEGVEQDERSRRILLALEDVSTDQRAILILRDARGLEYEQIAEVLGIAVGTVKSRLFRARLALRKAMETLEAPPRDAGDEEAQDKAGQDKAEEGQPSD